MTAYDYKAQRWLTGEEAKQERVLQIEDEIALLNHPDKGDEYAAFLGINRADRINQLESERIAISKLP